VPNVPEMSLQLINVSHFFRHKVHSNAANSNGGKCDYVAEPKCGGKCAKKGWKVSENNLKL